MKNYKDSENPMRILFDSKELCYKEPFGTLTPGQVCTLHIHIPASVGTVRVECVLELDVPIGR